MRNLMLAHINRDKLKNFKPWWNELKGLRKPIHKEDINELYESLAFIVDMLNVRHKKEWKEAIHYFLKVAKFTKIKSQKWLVHLNLGICYNELGKPLRALWHFHKAEKTQPNRWEIAKMNGTTYALLGWHKKAMEHWVDSFKINTGQFMFSPLPRNDAETWDFISLTFAISGQMEKSIIAALQALKEEMDNGPGLLPAEKIKILKTITNKKNTQ